MLKKISLLGGTNKLGQKENFEKIDFKKGNIYSIVGYTGSGKSQLIKDIEEVTSGDSITKRKILIDDELVTEGIEFLDENLIAHLGQNMKFLVDVKVKDFIKIHANCKNITDDTISERVINLANEITFEKIKEDDNLTRLSGGQTRALMIADIGLICNSPIVLIDEIENAGIDKIKALKLLVDINKIVLIVTHDPLIALMSNKRIVMKNGGIEKIIETTIKEKEVLKTLENINNYTNKIQENLRIGEYVC